MLLLQLLHQLLPFRLLLFQLPLFQLPRVLLCVAAVLCAAVQLRPQPTVPLGPAVHAQQRVDAPGVGQGTRKMREVKYL